MDHYDVLIVGAGIGGSLLARELSRRKKSVILVEKQQNYPKSKDTLVTNFELIKHFKLDKDVIFNQGNKLTYGTYPEKERASFTSAQAGIKDPIVLECNKFIEKNIENAIKHGCVYKINEEVKSIKKDKRSYVISLKKEPYVLKTRLVIDCSGISCSIGKLLGLFKQRYPVDYCHMFLTKGDNLRNPREAFFEIENFNKWFWIYPISKRASYAGLLTFFKPEHFGEVVHDINIYLAKHGHEYTKHYNVETGFTFINIYSPIKNGKIAADNVLFLGESGGTSTPLLGEGFRPICVCIRWLIKNIDRLLSGKAKMEDINEHFFSTVGHSYPVMRALVPFILRLSHEQTRKVMTQYLLKLSPKDLYRFTVLDFSDQEWRGLILNTIHAFSRAEKALLGLKKPVDTYRLIRLLLERKIINSISELW